MEVAPSPIACFERGDCCERLADASVHSATKGSTADGDVFTYKLNFASTAALLLGPGNLSRSHFTLLGPDGDDTARDDFPHARSPIAQHNGLMRTEPNDLPGADIIHQFHALRIAG